MGLSYGHPTSETELTADERLAYICLVRLKLGELWPLRYLFILRKEYIVIILANMYVN